MQCIAAEVLAVCDALCTHGSDCWHWSADEEAEGAEGGDDNEEWLTAGRSKKKKAVTRGTTSIQARPLLHFFHAT